MCYVVTKTGASLLKKTPILIIKPSARSRIKLLLIIIILDTTYFSTYEGDPKKQNYLLEGGTLVV